MRTPIIGIFSQYREEIGKITVSPEYFRAVQKFGGIPLLLPLEAKIDKLCSVLHSFDGFIYPGGGDINPLLFGEETHPECRAIDTNRDRIELMMFPEIRKTQKPILGICRGMQVINVALKGDIIQDIKTQWKSDYSVVIKQLDGMLERKDPISLIPEIGHYQIASNPVKTHNVLISKTSLLYQRIKKEKIAVNTFHHQAIKQLGEGLRVIGCSTDGMIEAIQLIDYPFCVGVQWHPEYLFEIDSDHAGVFEAFMTAVQLKIDK